MPQVGTETNPLRVAVVGAGPAGFYATERLLKEKSMVIEVDLYDRLPTPFGLVRHGVAPDHQKIKSVTKIYDRAANNDRFRYFGNVTFGEHVTIEAFRQFYHQVVYTVGAETDRTLNIPGIDHPNSHPATAFVAWYNGHPDYRHAEFDLSQENVAVIGVGNVAVDVARILCRTYDELATTDIADHALDALKHSQVKTVYMLGRRGPAQAAFTNAEAKELGEMLDADIEVLPEEGRLDKLSREAMVDADRETVRKVEIIQTLMEKPLKGKSRKLVIRFLVSPTELMKDENGRLTTMRLVKNKLFQNERGGLRPRATDEYEDIPVGLVFRSIGYRGVPLPGVPFREDWGTIPNEKGRVVTTETREPVLGEYTAGWIKRGPSGVIGTNKADAVETVECMLEDVQNGRILQPASPSPEAVASYVAEQQPNFVTYADWQYLDELEVTKGEPQGRPRVKFTDVEEMISTVRNR